MPEPRFALPPQYNPHDVERRLYQRWLDRGVFTPRADSPHEPYVIVIPPPNVTAILHVGHGLNNVIQDVLIRFERMRGREAEWLPGTDHAGIATQNVVERVLADEGTSRLDIGRDAFVARVWAFVRETGNAILEQLKVIGCSCDWSRTRFTFDAAYSRAVREVFVTLWEEGLIYRGHRVIHWCPHCRTALSDEEAEFADEMGTLYYIRYPVEAGPKPFLTVATTRPETLLGDTAVAVHPRDKRHAGFIGKTARLPIADVPIPIIADEAVDPKFGTGFVKVTPAHDANDFEIGLRHHLPMPLIMREDGSMGEEAGTPKGLPDGRGEGGRVPPPLQGLDRFEARAKIVQLLKAQGLLEKSEPYQHAVRHCYRCDTVVEPRLSDQWFVKMRPLAEPALAAYRSGEIRLVPERWGATYEHWMENIRDWNISRQLWWGHRIPVFSCTTCRHQWADREDPTRCPKCGGPVTQDPDVLDTWFSAWRKPFATVYLHGTVRDAQHRKMSKSLGNGIDPIDVVKLYGADALRWTVIGGGSLGADVILDPNDLETTFAPGRNFANKLWNIGRFILAQLPERVQPIDQFERAGLQLADRWILMRANDAVQVATSYLDEFKLDEAAKRCYEFVWGELADLYVEAVKPRLAGEDAGAAAAQAVLAHCCDVALRLLHPVVPFITEELWQKLPGRKPDELLVTASWPTFHPELVDSDLDAAFLRVKQAVEKIRIIRVEYKVPPRTRLRASIKPRGRDRRSVFEAESETIKRLAQVAELTFDGGMKGPVAYAVFGDGSEVFVALEGAIDVQQECRRLSGEVTRLDGQLAALAARLTNQDFVARAPADVVAKERDKERAWQEQRRALADKLTVLGCS